MDGYVMVELNTRSRILTVRLCDGRAKTEEQDTHSEEGMDAVALVHDGAERAQAHRPQLHQALPLLRRQRQQPLHAQARTFTLPCTLDSLQYLPNYTIASHSARL